MDDHFPAAPAGGIGDVAEMLLHYARTKTTFQTAKAMMLPADRYTDAKRWQAEMQSIFLRLPLLLATTAELRATGSYKAMDAMGRPVLLTRDAQGRVHAFLNVCAHRGAPVAEAGCGVRSRFICPYHAWSYGLDGSLLAVGGAASFGPLDRASRGLTALPCEERAGMIFVVLTPGVLIDVDAFYGAMLADFAAVDFAGYTYLGSRVIEGANWKIAMDGNLEGYHFAALHPTTIHPRTLSNLTYYEAFGPHLRIGFAQTAIEQKLGQVPRAQWDRQENDGFDFVRILFPNVSVFLAPEIAQLAQIYPGPTPDRNLTVLNYLRRDPPRDEADRVQIEQMMDFLRDVVNDEDYALGRKIQLGLASGALDTVVFGRNERGNQYFHEWVDWYATGGTDPSPRL